MNENQGHMPKKTPFLGTALKILAERWGFEPQIRFWRIHDFQSCSFGQLGHLSIFGCLHISCSGNKV